MTLRLDSEQARTLTRLVERTDLTGDGWRCMSCRQTFAAGPAFAAHPCERVNGRHLRAVA